MDVYVWVAKKKICQIKMTTTEVEAQSARSVGIENGKVGHGIVHVQCTHTNIEMVKRDTITTS